MILEDQVVRDGRGDDHQIAPAGGQRRAEQTGLGRLELAAVAAAAFRVDEQIVFLQDLGDIRLERRQVHRIFQVPTDGDRPRHVAMEQPERPAKHVDPRRDERRPHAVVVEHQQLDDRVGVALVVGGVHDPVRPRRRQDVLQVFRDALDLPEDRIERMLQGAIEGVALSCAQLLEIGADALARSHPFFAVVPSEVFEDLFVFEDRL